MQGRPRVLEERYAVPAVEIRRDRARATAGVATLQHGVAGQELGRRAVRSNAIPDYEVRTAGLDAEALDLPSIELHLDVDPEVPNDPARGITFPRRRGWRQDV